MQNFGDPTRELYGIFEKGLLWFLVGERLRLRSNVELFMRRIKVSELNSWNVRRLAQLTSSELVWIVQQHVLSVRFRRIERLKIFLGTNVDLHMRRIKQMIMYI